MIVLHRQGKWHFSFGSNAERYTGFLTELPSGGILCTVLPMQFEVNLPPNLEAGLLRGAGVETQPYLDITCSEKFILGKIPPPTNLPCPYFFSDKPTQVLVSQISDDRKYCRLRIEVADEKIGKSIRAYLTRYSFENDGRKRSDREHKERWQKIEAILARDKLSYAKLGEPGVYLTHRAIEALLHLCSRIDHPCKGDVRDLLTNRNVPKSERLAVARWLINEFENERDPFERDQLSLRIWENAVPQVADDLIRLLKDERFGESRSFFSLALAKTKDRRAADVIASVLRKPDMAYAGIQALAKLGATKYMPLIKGFLHDRDSDVRREAKKALKKLGAQLRHAPPPKHLIRVSTKIPRTLEEWSTNLDMDALEPTLKKLPKLVQAGFRKAEISEILAVAEEMKPEQTRAFRFPITFQEKKADLFVEIFMDDVNTPDLAIYAPASLVQQLIPRAHA